MMHSVRIWFRTASVSTQVRVVYKPTSFPLNRVVPTRALCEPPTEAPSILGAPFQYRRTGVFGSMLTGSPKNSIAGCAFFSRSPARPSPRTSESRIPILRCSMLGCLVHRYLSKLSENFGFRAAPYHCSHHYGARQPSSLQKRADRHR